MEIPQCQYLSCFSHISNSCQNFKIFKQEGNMFTYSWLTKLLMKLKSKSGKKTTVTVECSFWSQIIQANIWYLDQYKWWLQNNWWSLEKFIAALETRNCWEKNCIVALIGTSIIIKHWNFGILLYLAACD